VVLDRDHPALVDDDLLQQMVLSGPRWWSIALDGIELTHMTDTSTARVFLNLLNANIAWKWDGVLMSGGGNDLIDAANTSPNASVDKRLLLKPEEWSDGASPSRYLSDTGWATFAGHMSEVVDLLLAQRDKKAINRDAPIFFHTYDYVTPRNSPAGLGNGPWLVKALDAFGIPPVDWNAVYELMNQHAAMWLTPSPGDIPNRTCNVDSAVQPRGPARRARAMIGRTRSPTASSYRCLRRGAAAATSSP
jgi:hypothetical protein